MTTTDRLIDLYTACTGHYPAAVQPIIGSASSRTYFRISGNPTLIGTYSGNVAENKAFISMSGTLASYGVKVPRVVKISDDECFYLQQDLGDTSLYSIIIDEGYTPRTIELLKKSLSELLTFQIVGAEYSDENEYYPVKSMDGISVSWDLNYFKYCFAKVIGCDIDEVALEKDFEKLNGTISSASPKALIHRDFQSRNIMIVNNIPWFIDFQGARRGPVLYDVISCLKQARIKMPEQIQRELLDYYITLAAQRFGIDKSEISDTIDDIAIFRLLQVLGAYGYRGLIEGKPNFISPLESALASVESLLERKHTNYPYLHSLINEAADKVSALSDPSFCIYDNRLNVLVTSFSYKKGIPVDRSGNGGGFVFDCRAIHNPGRYDQYKSLTGEDRPVIEFLEHDGEIKPFLNSCKQLVDMSITKYLKRGFTHLSISFGCTGGQHRSVYSARHMADYIARKYGIHVTLYHREQHIVREYNVPSV